MGVKLHERLHFWTHTVWHMGHRTTKDAKQQNDIKRIQTRAANAQIDHFGSHASDPALTINNVYHCHQTQKLCFEKNFTRFLHFHFHFFLLSLSRPFFFIFRSTTTSRRRHLFSTGRVRPFLSPPSPRSFHPSWCPPEIGKWPTASVVDGGC